MIIHVSGPGDLDLSFNIKNTTRMSRVFESYAIRQHLDETLLCFQTAAGVVVSSDDTAHSLDLQDGDTLKCSENDMTIHVSGVGCDPLECKIRRSKTRMSRMFQHYANRLDLNPARLCFETAAGVAVTGDDTAYSLNLHDGDTLRCIWIYTGEGEEIPHTVTHVRVSASVTKLPRMAFHGRGRLAVVELHEGLVEIGYGAFDSCTSLASIQLPSSVETDCCSKLSHMGIPEGGRLWVKDGESLLDIEGLQSIVSAAWEVLLVVESPFLEAKQQRIPEQSTQKKNILKMILSLLKANEQQIEEQSTQQMTILNQIEKVQGIALAATQHLLAIDEGILIEAPPECVNRIIQTSKAIYNQIEMLQDKLAPPTNDHLACTTEKFFVFWRAFSLKMVRSSSSSLKSFGWGQITKLVDESTRLRPPPQGYLVSGAGSKFINGIYMLDPQKSVYGKASELEYTRIVPDNEKEAAGKKITLFRCTMRRSQQKWWFLSEADEQQPGTDKDIDYYQHKSKKHEEESPSLSGWLVCCRGAYRGAYPPPTLEPLAGPSGDGRSNIKNQLVEWVEENVLNEAARDICLSSKVARSVMSLYKFMATYQELHRKSVNHLTEDHIRPILSVCRKSTNLVALVELYLQFIIIRPSLPSNLQTIFDEGIKLILGKFERVCLRRWGMTTTNIHRIERQTQFEDVSFESDEDVTSVLRLLIDCYKSDSFVWPDSSNHLEILKKFSLRLVRSKLQTAREAGWDGVNILLVELSHGMHSMTKELADWIESNSLLSLALECSTHHEAIAMARSIVKMEEEFLQESHLQIALDTCRNTDSANVVAEMHRFISSVIDLLPDQRIIVDLIMQTAVIRRIELDDRSLSWLCIGNEGTNLMHGETLLNLDHFEAGDILRIVNAVERNSCLTRIRFTDDASFEDLDDESRREGFLGLVHALENSKTITQFHLSDCTFEGGAGNELLLAAGEMEPIRHLFLHGCDLSGWGVHSLIRTLRKLQRGLQVFGLENCHIDESVLRLILPSLKNLGELHGVSLRNSNLQNEGWLLLADLLACPQCNIHTLDIENTDVDSEGVQAIANALATNSKLQSLRIAGNNINEECWQAFSRQLCSTEKNTAWLSNHTLWSIDHPDISEELRLFLKFNEGTNKKRVVVKKILYRNGHISMAQLFGWGLRLVPNVVNWFDTAQDYLGCGEDTILALKDEDIGRRKLDAIYQFVKEMPLQFAR